MQEKPREEKLAPLGHLMTWTLAIIREPLQAMYPFHFIIPLFVREKLQQ